jgi:glutamyl-tRNA synthetase
VKQRVTRIAPSPTGALHIGNAFAFLINWAIARQNNWTIILRIEDLEGPRKKKNTIQKSIDILRWLEIDWDGDYILQSSELQHSKDVLDALINNNRAYHCDLSRKEIEEVAQAPHNTNSISKGIRPKDIQKHNQKIISTDTNWRFVVEPSSFIVKDMCCEETLQTVDHDFVIWTKANSPSYQLAVVVDDYRQGVTDVIRGNDLYHSAALQTQLYEALGWKPPTWWHLPLILGPDGKRLAKRHGDSRIETYRNKSVSPEKIIGLIAVWCSIQKDLAEMDAFTFCQTLDVPSIKKENKIFTRENEKWLLDS